MPDKLLTADAISDYFLSLVDEDAGDNISNLKLQKLLYYAQGFCLAIHDRPLFKDEIKAWAHGPVIPTVYHKYKEHGAGAIPLPTDVNFGRYSGDMKELLDDIYTVFGQYSAWKLREMTHVEPPWKNTTRNTIIPHRALKAYFKTRVKKDE